ncbi:MAG: glycosyltransferase family 4 protein [Patescibacteria group bacterium]
MKKILILKFPFSSLFGGGERHTLLLVEGLRKKGFDFFLVSSCPVLLREFRARKWHARRARVGLEPVSKGALLMWPFTIVYTVLYLSLILSYYRFRKGVTAVYCLSLTEKIAATLPARMLGMRVYWAEHVTFERWLTKNPLRPLYRFLSRCATVIAISAVIREQLTNVIGVPDRSVKLVYCGVDTSRFVMRERRWEHAARFNVGCVARLESEKGIEYLLQAINIIREFVPSVRLIVVGEGSERKKLVWLSEQLGLKEIIQWIGYQREVERWYGYFDAYVLPSVKRESFGVTLVEAMASGVPVVASKIGGTQEIIDPGKTGLLAEPGSGRDLADQLLYLYNNRSEAKEMALRARVKVEERFSLERMERDFYLLFRK